MQRRQLRHACSLLRPEFKHAEVDLQSTCTERVLDLCQILEKTPEQV